MHLALIAQGRSPEIPESADVYGWLIGSWELDFPCYYGLGEPSQSLEGEVHFGWVLQGRAMQDVSIIRQSSEKGDESGNIITYGTTLRVWDQSIQAWRITWINPARNHREEQIGRRSGQDIVQIGIRPDGTPTRWTFKEITENGFHWLGEALEPDGKTWKIEAEFRSRRLR